MKICNACGASKPLDDYPPDTQNSDGRKGKCRSCVVQRQRELRAANPERDRQWVERNQERVLEQKRAYRSRNADRLREDGRERAKRYRDTPEGAERTRQRARDSYARHREQCAIADKHRRAAEPEKVRAREAVANAVRRGRIVKPQTCERCAMPHPGLNAHHEDYSKPLDVNWLCPKCHKARHAELADARVSISEDGTVTT